MIDVWQVLQYVLCIVLVFGFSVWLKYDLKRKKYSNYIPSSPTRWFQFSGDMRHSENKDLKKILPKRNVSIYHIGNGAVHILGKKGLFAAWLFYVLFTVIVKAKVAEDFFNRSRNFEKAWLYKLAQPWLGTGLITSSGDKWKSRRKLLTPAFHFDILKEFLPIMNEQAQVLVRNLRKEVEKPWIDVVHPITLCSLDIICETTLGVHIGAQDNSDSEYVQAVTRTTENLISRMMNPLLWPNIIYRFTKNGRQFYKDLHLLHNFTIKIIQERKKNFLENTEVEMNRKRKPLMDILLKHHIEDNSLTEEDIREEVDTISFAGHDTTAMAVSWALYLIGLHRDVQTEVQKELDSIFGEDYDRPVTVDDLKEMKHLECVLKESLRIYPSVPMIGRQFDEEIALIGYKIPKGTMCLVMIQHLHLNPEYFPEPEKFIPERFLPENSIGRNPYAYIPFSAGPRNCIGQKFALMEEKVLVANILRNFDVKSLDHRDKIFLAPELVLRPVGPLRVKFSLRET